MDADTSAHAQAAYFAALRRLGPVGRLQRGFALTAFTRQLSEAGIRTRHPDYSEDEVQWALKRLLVGDELFKRAWPHGPLLAP